MWDETWSPWIVALADSKLTRSAPPPEVCSFLKHADDITNPFENYASTWFLRFTEAAATAAPATQLDVDMRLPFIECTRDMVYVLTADKYWERVYAMGSAKWMCNFPENWMIWNGEASIAYGTRLTQHRTRQMLDKHHQQLGDHIYFMACSVVAAVFSLSSARTLSFWRSHAEMIARGYIAPLGLLYDDLVFAPPPNIYIAYRQSQFRHRIPEWLTMITALAVMGKRFGGKRRLVPAGAAQRHIGPAWTILKSADPWLSLHTIQMNPTLQPFLGPALQRMRWALHTGLVKPAVCPLLFSGPVAKLARQSTQPWAPQTHYLHGAGTRRAAHLLVLIGNRLMHGGALPPELWRLVMQLALQRCTWPVCWPHYTAS